MFQDGASNVETTSKKGDEEENQKDHHTRIPIGRKIYEFYNAPFTKFWFNTVSQESNTLISKAVLKLTQGVCILSPDLKMD